jgi:S-adenosyl-L-methionine hydrolase (adenosine-forming)
MTVSLPRPIVTLTSDFGTDSSYVAQMKGVILSRNPDVCLVDLSHSVPPQDVRSGAILLADTCFRFPPRTIHVAVVDPGVGTERQIVFAQVANQRCIAPNNGLLTLVCRRTAASHLVTVTNRLYFLPEVSNTFHGRDILAPVAAHLSLGLNPQRLGEAIDYLIELPFPEPSIEIDRIAGQILQIDSFGNLITNITERDLVKLQKVAASITVRGPSVTVHGLSTTYGEQPPGSYVALIGSSGRLEIARVNGNAASSLSAQLDDSVEVLG